jgi:hypothetical protein
MSKLTFRKGPPLLGSLAIAAPPILLVLVLACPAIALAKADPRFVFHFFYGRICLDLVGLAMSGRFFPTPASDHVSGLNIKEQNVLL